MVDMVTSAMFEWIGCTIWKGAEWAVFYWNILYDMRLNSTRSKFSSTDEIRSDELGQSRAG